MTYKPDEEEDASPSEDTKASTDEPNESQSLDIVPVPNVPEPSPPPSNAFGSDDLLVIASPVTSFIKPYNLRSINY